jgi:aconitate hydratase
LFGIPRKGQVRYSTDLELDLGSVVPSVAGPKRPQDRIQLPDLKREFVSAFSRPVTENGFGKAPEELNRTHPVAGGPAGTEMRHGSVLIAAITSCTNTSNPSVMLAAGLLARKAVERGLRVGPLVKASLAPGSRVVTEYLNRTGLQPYLDQLGFTLVGYGCTTCIGNSSPLPAAVEETIGKYDVVAASVLSGNRNFEARVHQSIKANFLMSPPLVVAFALAGRIDIDLSREPVGKDREGREVFLKDLWPTLKEISDLMQSALDPETFRQLYRNFADQNPKWNEIPASTGNVYTWDPRSTYIQEPPFFRTSACNRATSAKFGARGRWGFLETVSPRTTFPRGQHQEDLAAGGIFSNRACRSRNSTATARAGQ